MIKGFKNFLMQGDIVVTAVGLVIALAFSTLVKAFTDNVITPLINAAAGGQLHSGLGWTVHGQRITLGTFLSAVVYFVLLMLAVYVTIVVPYRSYMRRRGHSVFTPPPATKSCPECCSSGLPMAATRCMYCTAELPGEAAPPVAAPAGNVPSGGAPTATATASGPS
ncbi:MAG TPA: MscL family protein [Acidimicrobiales bacterium]|nr:MscL family protein [Acidimicrobiales bacterium]